MGTQQADDLNETVKFAHLISTENDAYIALYIDPVELLNSVPRQIQHFGIARAVGPFVEFDGQCLQVYVTDDWAKVKPGQWMLQVHPRWHEFDRRPCEREYIHRSQVATYIQGAIKNPSATEDTKLVVDDRELYLRWLHAIGAVNVTPDDIIDIQKIADELTDRGVPLNLTSWVGGSYPDWRKSMSHFLDGTRVGQSMHGAFYTLVDLQCLAKVLVWNSPQPLPAEGSTSQASTCSHDGQWRSSWHYGPTACPECNEVFTYLLKCLGCKMKACSKCKNAILRDRSRWRPKRHYGPIACPECNEVFTYLLKGPGCEMKACGKCRNAILTNRRAPPRISDDDNKGVIKQPPSSKPGMIRGLETYDSARDASQDLPKIEDLPARTPESPAPNCRMPKSRTLKSPKTMTTNSCPKDARKARTQSIRNLNLTETTQVKPSAKDTSTSQDLSEIENSSARTPDSPKTMSTNSYKNISKARRAGKKAWLAPTQSIGNLNITETAQIKPSVGDTSQDLPEIKESPTRTPDSPEAMTTNSDPEDARRARTQSIRSLNVAEAAQTKPLARDASQDLPKIKDSPTRTPDSPKETMTTNPHPEDDGSARIQSISNLNVTETAQVKTSARDIQESVQHSGASPDIRSHPTTRETGQDQAMHGHGDQTDQVATQDPMPDSQAGNQDKSQDSSPIQTQFSVQHHPAPQENPLRQSESNRETGQDQAMHGDQRNQVATQDPMPDSQAGYQDKCQDSSPTQAQSSAQNRPAPQENPSRQSEANRNRRKARQRKKKNHDQASLPQPGTINMAGPSAPRDEPRSNMEAKELADLMLRRRDAAAELLLTLRRPAGSAPPDISAKRPGTQRSNHDQASMSQPGTNIMGGQSAPRDEPRSTEEAETSTQGTVAETISSFSHPAGSALPNMSAERQRTQSSNDEDTVGIEETNPHSQCSATESRTQSPIIRTPSTPTTPSEDPLDDSTLDISANHPNTTPVGTPPNIEVEIKEEDSTAAVDIPTSQSSRLHGLDCSVKKKKYLSEEELLDLF